jgi:hypothetical protein
VQVNEELLGRRIVATPGGGCDLDWKAGDPRPRLERVRPHGWAILGLADADQANFGDVLCTTHSNIRIKCGCDATFPQNAGIR